MGNRLYILLGTLFLVLIVPITLRKVFGRSETLTHDGASELIILTPHTEPIRREFEEAFSAWHKAKYGQPVDILYVTFGGAAEMVKTLESRRETTFKQRGTYEIDLAWGGGDVTFDIQLKPYLAPLPINAELMKAAFPSPTLAGLKLYEPEMKWVGVVLSKFGILFNRDVVAKLGLPEPKMWTDLIDARYRGWIVLADPTRSSSAKAAYMVIIEREMADAVEALPVADRADPAKKQAAEDIGWARGMGRLRLIAANARTFQAGSESVPGVVSSGDVAAGMTIDFYGHTQIEYIGDKRLGYVEPLNATAINPDPIALLQGAQHKETAVRFVEFLLSDEGQRLWNIKAGLPGGPKLTSLHRLPIRPSAYADTSNFTDKVNPFGESPTFNTSRSRTKTFGIVGELMQASMIDTLDELRATRDAIEKSPHADELRQRLGTFPLDQAKALARAKEYDEAKKNPARRLEMLRQWTAEFKDEYRMLRADAAK